ncbi:hypothetical protein, partial [Mesorhizobium sp.]|uniref:hypothetical protein n=1 Tax=Mesorhizobium sp. TaxID=1871066 RepID=UPI0025BD92D8
LQSGPYPQITGDAADMTPNRQAQQTPTQTDSRKSQNPARSDKTNPINVIKIEKGATFAAAC